MDASDDPQIKLQSDDPNHLDAAALAFYRRTLTQLSAADVAFLVGGAFALQRFTDLGRDTRDFDIFVRRSDYDHLMQLLATKGCRIEHAFPHWLGKAHCGADFVDVIFSSGNGVVEVDDEWFAHAESAQVLGLPVLVCPPEEMIWSKAYVMERERFDGADILHLLRAVGPGLDWRRLLRRFGADWPVLHSHLVMFDFVYPGERAALPDWVRAELLRRAQTQLRTPPAAAKLCRGTLLSRSQYLIDIERWGYQDARLLPGGGMSAREVARWTDAIDKEC